MIFQYLSALALSLRRIKTVTLFSSSSTYQDCNGFPMLSIKWCTVIAPIKFRKDLVLYNMTGFVHLLHATFIERDSSVSTDHRIYHYKQCNVICNVVVSALARR